VGRYLREKTPGLDHAPNRGIREALAEVGLFDLALDVGTPSLGGGDLDILYRFIKSGWIFRYEPGALVRHRHRREMAALDRQMHAYGYSLRCGFERVERRYPEDRRVIRKLRAGIGATGPWAGCFARGGCLNPTRRGWSGLKSVGISGRGVVT